MQDNLLICLKFKKRVSITTINVRIATQNIINLLLHFLTQTHERYIDIDQTA